MKVVKCGMLAGDCSALIGESKRGAMWKLRNGRAVLKARQGDWWYWKPAAASNLVEREAGGMATLGEQGIGRVQQMVQQQQDGKSASVDMHSCGVIAPSEYYRPLPNSYAIVQRQSVGKIISSMKEMIDADTLGDRCRRCRGPEWLTHVPGCRITCFRTDTCNTNVKALQLVDPIVEEPATNNYREQLVDLYSKHNPAKLGGIDGLLTRYAGQEQRFISIAREKYGGGGGGGGPLYFERGPVHLSPRGPVVTNKIATQTTDGALAVNILRALASMFSGRTWPATKKELETAIRKTRTGPQDIKKTMQSVRPLWRSSGCLSSKGTQKNPFAWNLRNVRSVLESKTPQQSGAPPDVKPCGSPFQYVDKTDKLEAAVAAILQSTSDKAEPDSHDTPARNDAESAVAIGIKSGVNGLSLVMFATSEDVFLFDCAALTVEIVVGALAGIYESNGVTKVAYDMHHIAHSLVPTSFEFKGTFDIQLAIELLTGDPSSSFSECIAQLNPDANLAQRADNRLKADASYDIRPLSPAAKERAAREMRALLGVYPRLLEAEEASLNTIKTASDLRAEVGAKSTGARHIVFDAANSYAIASAELMQTVRPADMHVPEPLVVSNDTDVLLNLLPADIGNELRHTDGTPSDLTALLSDIVLDKGRPACAWIDGKRVRLGADGRVISIEDINAVLEALGGFGSDNRAGLEQQLHRISGMRNRCGDVIGLTMRIGRHVSGNADMISDLLFGDDRSILFLGEPGSGKTTIVREATRLLSMESNVCIVDTSNEIAGDGDIPHPCIGLARRMMVASLSDQADVMVECVQNHTPEIMVIDEIGRSAEVEAARTCKQRGVRMIASAHGDLRKLVKNKQLRGLVGGIESVTLGDMAAKAEAKKHGGSGLQKVKAQRGGTPTFDIIVELRRGEQHEWRIIADAGRAVDAILEGQPMSVQRRTRNAESGSVELAAEPL
jgi:stage III sporulation protein SpoIIIAA